MVAICQSESDKDSSFALRANGKIDAGETKHNLLPSFTVLGSISLRRIITGVWLIDERTCSFQFCFGIARSHKAEVPDFYKPCRKYMEQKPAYKLRRGDGDKSVSTGMLVVPGPESDGLRTDIGQPVVGDGDPVGVSAKVVVGFL